MSHKHIEWMGKECAHSAPICHQLVVHDVQNFVLVLRVKAEVLLQIYTFGRKGPMDGTTVPA